VSSKDFERLLSYMYHGEVSVPQAELLSLISAAKGLGIRGLVEEVVEGDGGQDIQNNSEKDIKDTRGKKREADICESQNLKNKKPKPSFPKLQHNIAQKPWHKSEGFKSPNPPKATQPLEGISPPIPQDKDIMQEGDDLKQTDEIKLAKDIEQKMKDKDENDREIRIGPRGLTSFVEVNVKQEEDENPQEDANIAESAGILEDHWLMHKRTSTWY
jgi:hypothetical protein